MASMILDSIKYVNDHYGWKAIPGFILNSFIEDLSGFILVGEFKDTIQPVPPKLPVEIREATPEDRERFRNIIPPFRINRFVKKMEAGERCVVALLNGEVIYFAWASFAGQDTAVESPMKLGPKDAYIWGAYCLPEYRRFGLGTSVQSYHEDLLRQNGYQTAYRIVRVNNQASQNLCKRLKLKIIGRGYGVRIFKWRIYFRMKYENK